MQEQVKRGPGRPRKAETRRHIDVTLSRETIEYLDSSYSMSRSQFIEMLVQAYKKSHPVPLS